MPHKKHKVVPNEASTVSNPHLQKEKPSTLEQLNPSSSKLVQDKHPSKHRHKTHGHSSKTMTEEPKKKEDPSKMIEESSKKKEDASKKREELSKKKEELSKKNEKLPIARNEPHKEPHKDHINRSKSFKVDVREEDYDNLLTDMNSSRLLELEYKKKRSSLTGVGTKFFPANDDQKPIERTSVEKLLVYTPQGVPYINMHNLIWAPKNT